MTVHVLFAGAAQGVAAAGPFRPALHGSEHGIAGQALMIAYFLTAVALMAVALRTKPRPEYQLGGDAESAEGSAGSAPPPRASSHGDGERPGPKSSDMRG